MQDRNLRRANLAVEFDVDTTTIIRWEQSGPPRDRIPEVAGFFDVSPGYLMGWDRKAA